MGLLRNALRAATGADDAKNGLSGPHLPFAKQQLYLRPASMQSTRPTSPQAPVLRFEWPQARDHPVSSNAAYSMSSAGYDPRYEEPQDTKYRAATYNKSYSDSYDRSSPQSSTDPPSYATTNQKYGRFGHAPSRYEDDYEDMVPAQSFRKQRGSD